MYIGGSVPLVKILVVLNDIFTTVFAPIFAATFAAIITAAVFIIKIWVGMTGSYITCLLWGRYIQDRGPLVFLASQ